MQTLTVRNITFGKGRPKICVPIVAQNMAELTAQAEALKHTKADLCEWRTDWFCEQEKIAEASQVLRGILPDMPLLFTCRTKTEGGEQELSHDAYLQMCTCLLEQDACDLIDIELFTAGKDASELIKKAHGHNKAVIVSSHDFSGTPSEEDILARLRQMEALGGDLLKIAVMPNSPADVLTLLSATVKMNSYTSRPLITISMGDMGAISRVCGEVFGSCMTFGAAEMTSAPGQIPVGRLKEMLDIFTCETGWKLVDAYYIPVSEADQYIADREYYAEKAAAIFREFYPRVAREWAGSEDGEAVTACDENGRLMMHVHLDPGNIKKMKAADRKGELRQWLLADYIKED